MRNVLLLLTMFIISPVVWAQQEAEEPTTVAETLYILPKNGQSLAFEAAIAAHNKKYHPAGNPGMALLRYVDYGDRGGWYVWVMRGNYATLDNRPADKEHDADWAKTVDPLVMEYGPTTLWTMNRDLSVNPTQTDEKSKMRLWNVKFKPNQQYRFSDLMKKLKPAMEAVDRSMIILNNEVNSLNSPDVAFIWPFDKYSEWEEEGDSLTDAYDELHGEGSWISFLDDWRAIVDTVDEEIRTKK